MVKSVLYAAIGFVNDLLDSLGRRPFFGDGPVASRDIHDVSALRRMENCERAERGPRQHHGARSRD